MGYVRIYPLCFQSDKKQHMYLDSTDKSQPFKTNPINASFLIASSLPSTVTLPPKGSSSSPTSPDGNVPHVAPRRIHIHAHPSPIPVSYATVRTTIPAILDDFARTHSGRRPDVIVHMGIAPTRSYYSVETFARRDGYRMADIYGQLGYDDGEKVWKELGLPAVLKPGPANGTETDPSVSPASAEAAPKPQNRSHPSPADAHFLQTWRSFAPAGTDLRISEDAGRYLCEFIFYTSLAQALREGRDRSVIFFHVPAWHDEENVRVGMEVAVALIKTLVRCWVEERGEREKEGV